LHCRKYIRNHCFYTIGQKISTEHWLKIIIDLDWPYQNWGKTLYYTCQIHFWKYFWNFKQVESDSCIMVNTIEINVFQLFDNLPLNIAWKCWWIWIAHTKIEWNTLLHISNRFVEAFLKFTTSWQWQLQHGYCS